ncbi:hypothetical protein P886_3415 [Alteromonadaceae bacterium 2753L.S.0a.02]|nr:hypothetical protein P886_3415 [Alteromonadaceae bacterium 2753L.S.0a.02]
MSLYNQSVNLTQPATCLFGVAAPLYPKSHSTGRASYLSVIPRRVGFLSSVARNVEIDFNEHFGYIGSLSEEVYLVLACRKGGGTQY